MNAKKKRLKRIYKQGLMNVEERAAYNKERDNEQFQRDKRRNKKLKQT
jgi:hypothetical protein